MDNIKEGDWVIYDRKINLVRKCSYSDSLELSDGYICTSCSDLSHARPLNLRNKVIAENIDHYYKSLRKIDGEAGFNYPDINRYFTSLTIEAIDADDKEIRGFYDKAMNFVKLARDYAKIIDGVYLFREASCK